jgi:hypothetical protein
MVPAPATAHHCAVDELSPEVNDITTLPAPWWEDGKPRPGLSFSDRLKQLIKPKKPDPVEGWGADRMK